MALTSTNSRNNETTLQALVRTLGRLSRSLSETVTLISAARVLAADIEMGHAPSEQALKDLGLANIAMPASWR